MPKHLLSMAMALCMAPAAHAAANFPAKPVRITVSQTPGGAPDALARIVATRGAVVRSSRAHLD